MEVETTTLLNARYLIAVTRAVTPDPARGLAYVDNFFLSTDTSGYNIELMCLKL